MTTKYQQVSQYIYMCTYTYMCLSHVYNIKSIDLHTNGTNMPVFVFFRRGGGEAPAHNWGVGQHKNTCGCICRRSVTEGGKKQNKCPSLPNELPFLLLSSSHHVGTTHSIGQDYVTDVTEVFVSEYKSDVAFDVRKKFLQTWVLVQVTSDGLSNGGVFTCESVCVCVCVCGVISTVKRENVS